MSVQITTFKNNENRPAEQEPSSSKRSRRNRSEKSDRRSLASASSKSNTGNSDGSRKLFIKAIKIFVILLFVLALLTWIFYSYASQFQDKVVTRSIINNRSGKSFAAPGLVETETGEIRLAFEIPGRIRMLSVREGDSVQAGQTLAALDVSSLVAEKVVIETDYAVAVSDLLRLQTDLDLEILYLEKERDRFRAEYNQLAAGARAGDIETAEAAVRSAELEWMRLVKEAERLSDPQLINEQKRSNAKDSAEHAASVLDMRRAELENLKDGPAPEALKTADVRISVAEAQLESARQSRNLKIDVARKRTDRIQAEIERFKTQIEKSELRSPIDGKVIWKYRYSGETIGVMPPEPILAVADDRVLYVRADVDESDFPKLFLGQAASIRCDAYPDQTFSGIVERISPSTGRKRFSTGEARERVDVRIVEVVIRLNEPVNWPLSLRVTAYFDDALSTQSSEPAPAAEVIQ